MPQVIGQELLTQLSHASSEVTGMKPEQNKQPHRRVFTTRCEAGYANGLSIWRVNHGLAQKIFDGRKWKDRGYQALLIANSNT